MNQPSNSTKTTQAPKNAWVACPRPSPRANLRLFCFPYSGAGASIFYTWPDVLPAAIQVCPIELPGHGTRLTEPLFTRLPPLVQAAASALLPHLDQPFALFGHSLGSLVTFELARCLRRQYNLSTVHLFVSGHDAPHIPDTDPPIHALPEAEFVAELRRLNGMPEEILENAELMQLLLPILRADFEICETYVYQADEPLDCPLSAFGGLQDDGLTRQGLEAWSEHTTAAFSPRMFPGDHFFLNTERMLLLQAIARDLERFL